jgi:hypothetical protein
VPKPLPAEPARLHFPPVSRFARTQCHGRQDVSRLRKMLEISVFLGMASFLFFPVAVGVNDQEAKNDQTDNKYDDNERLVSPHIAHKTRKIGAHFRLIYTMPGERQNDGLKRMVADSCRLLLLLRRNQRY